MKKRLVSMMMFLILTISISTMAFAASDYFDVTVPGQQGDVEVSTVRKERSTAYFTIELQSLSTGTTCLCAWTESKTFGKNYSNPYYQVECIEEDVPYTNTPAVGENVVLNLDNPVYTIIGVYAQGTWTPN